MINVGFTERQLWSHILAEAEKAAGEDDFLRELMADWIMLHGTLPEAIIGRIVSTISPGHLSPSLLETLRSLLNENHSILASAVFDITAALERDPATTRALHVVLHAKGFLGIQIHRFSHELWRVGRRELALYLQGSASRALQVDIHPAARLGVGLFFDHATGIVIGETSVVDDNVALMQNVTLGGNGKDTGERHPKVREGVLVGAGATILGNIEVGASARIGAGSVVLKPVAPGTTVAGVPARAIGKAVSIEPSRAMDHVFALQGDRRTHLAERIQR
ncbi:serine O-acetyltransferase EpsC [Rhizobium altiplani]|nr:serine O-acetyltransferase EpsC [Rhizobium altiplani]